MAVPCSACPLRAAGALHEMSDADVHRTRRFKSGERTIDASTPLMTEGLNTSQSFTALAAMGVRYKTLPDGRRPVRNFVLPGDFIGLQASLSGEITNSVEARTNVRLCVFDRASFYDLFRCNPARAFDMTWLAAVEEHFPSEALATVGQRSTAQSIWALARPWLRGQPLRLARGDGMPLRSPSAGHRGRDGPVAFAYQQDPVFAARSAACRLKLRARDGS